MHLTHMPDRGHASSSYELLMGFKNISVKDGEKLRNPFNIFHIYILTDQGFIKNILLDIILISFVMFNTQAFYIGQLIWKVPAHSEMNTFIT